MQPRASFVLVCLLAILCVVTGQQQAEPPHEHTYTVYHRLAHGREFVKRGRVVVTPSKAVAWYVAADDVNTGAGLALTAQGEDTPDKRANWTYLIRIVDDEDRSRAFLSFTKWCLLESSRFEDEIVAHLDNRGELYHFDYYTAHDTCNLTATTTNPRFATTVQTITSNSGPRPRLTGPVATNPDGTVMQPPPEKSFIQKYWVYIVPLLLVLLFSGPPPEEEGQGRPGGGGGSGGAQGGGGGGGGGGARGGR